MRWTFVFVLCAGLFMLTACQDHEARLELQRLQMELQQQKENRGSSNSNDDLVKLLLARDAQPQDGASDRRLNAMGDDMRAGFEALRKVLEENRRETDRRIGDLDDRLKRVSDFETALGNLRTAIENLESKSRGLDPNEVLSVHKEMIRIEASLNTEKAAREAAEAKVANLEQQIERTRLELADARADVEGLQGDDISRHPMYRKQHIELREAQAELSRARSDFENLEREHKALLEQLRQGVRPRPSEEPDRVLDPDSYRFTGSVAEISKSGNRPSNLIVTIRTGQVPAVGTELLVLDSRNDRVCMVRVVRHYHMSDNPDLPVDEIGCIAVDEDARKPITRGDTVVWVRVDEETRGNAGGE